MEIYLLHQLPVSTYVHQVDHIDYLECYLFQNQILMVCKVTINIILSLQIPMLRHLPFYLLFICIVLSNLIFRNW